MKRLLAILFLVIPLSAQDPAEITVSIAVKGSDQQMKDVYEKFALSKGWTRTVEINKETLDNPETAQVFAERYLENYIIGEIRNYDAATARRIAEEQIFTKIATELRPKKIK